MELLYFRIEDQTFGVDLSELDEVLFMAAVAPLTGVPSFVTGAFNLRGTPLPVMDLTQRLGFKRSRVSDAHGLSVYPVTARLLVTSADKKPFAAILDGWQGVGELSKASVEPNVIQDRNLPDYVDGLCLDGGEIIQMIRIRKALSVEELAQLYRRNPELGTSL